MDNREIYHSSNERIPTEVTENLRELFPEYGDISYEEILIQESVYQSIQEISKQNTGTSNLAGSFSNWLTRQEEEPSQIENFESQIALDEALARSLQELEMDFDDLSTAELCSNEFGSKGTSESSERGASQNARHEHIYTENTSYQGTSQNAGHEHINTENMSYEHLQSLGESIGQESKGLSRDRISWLSTFKYKSGFFSKKKKQEQCVICCVEYKNGDSLCSLPCKHEYHKNCIGKWLEDNKNCPICKKEVT